VASLSICKTPPWFVFSNIILRPPFISFYSREFGYVHTEGRRSKGVLNVSVLYVLERQVMIKLADSPDLCWKVAQEYQRNPIYSEDEKLMNRAYAPVRTRLIHSELLYCDDLLCVHIRIL
jgi:hypothetical protein